MARVSLTKQYDYESQIIDVQGNTVLSSSELKIGFANVLPHAIIVTKSVYPEGHESEDDMFEDVKYMKLKYGVIDRKGKILQKPEYDKIEVLDGDMLALLKDGKWWLYNSQKNKLGEQGYDKIRTDLFRYSLQIQFNKKWGVSDNEGNIIIKPRYDSVGTAWADCITVGTGGKFTYADAKGKEIAPLKYQMTFAMENGVGFFCYE